MLLNAVSRVVISYYTTIDVNKMIKLNEEHDFTRKYNKWADKNYSNVKDIYSNSDVTKILIYTCTFMPNECYDVFKHDSDDIVDDIQNFKKFIIKYDSS